MTYILHLKVEEMYILKMFLLNILHVYIKHRCFFKKKLGNYTDSCTYHKKPALTGFRMMTACKQAATNHLVVMAVSAAVVMSLTVAMPFQETSEAGIAANINQVQKKLKFSINAFSLITRPSCVSAYDIHLM